MKKALLIDGNNILFKAYYATMYQGANLHSLKGIPTNAVYAFIRMVSKFIQQNHYDALFVGFDAGKETFRTKILSSYKGTRPQTPDELIIQFDLVKEFLDLAQIPWWQIQNYEADDLIGTIAKNEVAKKYQIDIISNDKDLYQILAKNINILIPQKGLSEIKKFGISDLLNEYQLTPNQIPDYKGLMGDNSDNLPGIKGIGPKTAIKLIQKYHSLENVIANVNELSPKENRLITENQKLGILTKELATITDKAPLKITLDDCTYDCEKLHNQAVETFYQKYEMKSLLKNKIQKQINETEIEIKLLTAWDDKYNANENDLWVEVCFEDYLHDKVFALAIKNEFGTFYLNHETIAKDQKLKCFLETKKYQKNVWDIKKTFISLNNNFNINCDGFISDLMIGTYLLHANEKIVFSNFPSLLKISASYNINDEEFYGKGVKRSFTNNDQLLSQFLAQKVALVHEGKIKLDHELKTNNLWDLYQTIELPTVYSLISMELNGIKVDQKQLVKMTEKTNEQLINLENKINKIANRNINPNSPKQMSEYLFNELKLPNYKKNSTAYEVLINLKGQHEVINILLQYRKMQKLYGTYLIGLTRFISNDGKIHPCYNQVQASTGRISASDPNIQNITIRDLEQKEVRKIFIASTNKQKIVACDYSQIELRILAHISGDSHLIAAFNNNQDIHTDTASKILNKNLKQVSKEERSKAKAVNFGIIYGISSYGLSQQLKISKQEAQDFIDKYFAIYPQIKDYINKTVAFCKKNGYVTTLFNRKRYVPEINNHNYNIKEFGERIAMNMPIQGTAADIIKLAMIKIDQAIKKGEIKANLIAQVHDELIFEVEEKVLTKTMKQINEIMTSVVRLKIPLVANVSYADNWFDLK